MHVTVEKKQLQDLVKTVAIAVPAKTTLPVLGSLLLTATDDRLTIAGTDLDSWLEGSIEAEISVPGAATISCRMLAAILKHLPDAPVEIVSLHPTRCELECQGDAWSLEALPPEEFPTKPEMPEDGAALPAADVAQALKDTSFAASSEEHRPILNSVLMRLADVFLTFAATDGHCLVESAIEHGSQLSDLLIPPSSFKALAKVASVGGAGVLRVSRNGRFARFRGPDLEVIARLVEGDYPNYRKVVPDAPARVAVVDRSKLDAALRRVAVLVERDFNHRVRCFFSDEGLEMRSARPDQGDSRVAIPLESYVGEPIETSWNAKLFGSVLRQVPCDRVRIEMTDPEHAVLLRPADPPESGRRFTGLAMPLRDLD